MKNTPDLESRRFDVAESVRSSGLLRFSHAAMATLFEVICVHPDPRYARQAAQEVV